MTASRPQRRRPGDTSPIGGQLTPQPEPIKVGDQITPTGSQSAEQTDSVTSAVPESQSLDLPKYLTLVRKEARVREDQAEALTQLRRRLHGQRNDKTEPLTDNTLIRIAIDLLLANAETLHGDSETQLRDSVTNRLTN